MSWIVHLQHYPAQLSSEHSAFTVETQHDVWRQMDYRALDGIRIRQIDFSGGRAHSSDPLPELARA